jgi:hypothetical protein
MARYQFECMKFVELNLMGVDFVVTYMNLLEVNAFDMAAVDMNDYYKLKCLFHYTSSVPVVDNAVYHIDCMSVATTGLVVIRVTATVVVVNKAYGLIALSSENK